MSARLHYRDELESESMEHSWPPLSKALYLQGSKGSRDTEGGCRMISGNLKHTFIHPLSILLIFVMVGGGQVGANPS